MTRCKYAFDKSEEVCSNCDGIKIVFDDGEEIDAIECKDFEPEIPEEYEDEKEETQKEEKEELPWENDTVEQANSCQKQTKNENTIINTPKEKEVLKNENTTSQAKVRTIKFMVGATVEVKGTYHKFSAEEEWELNDKCDLEKERELLWQHLKDMVDKNVEEVQ